MIKYESKAFKVNLKKQIHWFSRQSAIGKSYLPEFMRSVGVIDISIFVIDCKEKFDDIGNIVSIMNENDIILIDRGDLYLNSDDLNKLLAYTEYPILIDRKKGLPMSIRKYGSPVYIEYDGRSMRLYDENDN